MKRYFFFLLLLVFSAGLPLALSFKKQPEIRLIPEPKNQEVFVAEVKDSFPDVEEHWAKEAIDSLHNAGVVEGHEDGNFYPDWDLTRAEAVKIAMMAFGLDTSSMDGSVSNYSDVGEEDWFKNFVIYATEMGIIKGYPDDTFRPEAPVTRAEALKIFLETAGFIELSPSEDNFIDVDSVRDWFAKYSAFGKKSGIVSGYEDGTFQGNRTITRAEACVIVQNLIDYLAGTE